MSFYHRYLSSLRLHPSRMSRCWLKAMMTPQTFLLMGARCHRCHRSTGGETSWQNAAAVNVWFLTTIHIRIMISWSNPPQVGRGRVTAPVQVHTAHLLHLHHCRTPPTATESWWSVWFEELDKVCTHSSNSRTDAGWHVHHPTEAVNCCWEQTSVGSCKDPCRWVSMSSTEHL